MPDLAQVFTGVNTDLALTNLSQVFGTDLGYERSWQEELGIRQHLAAHLSLDLTGFHQATDSAVIPHFANLRNPTRNDSPNNLLQFTKGGHFGAQGIATSVSYSAPPLRLLVSYQYLDADKQLTAGAPNDWSRPHTLTASLEFRAPPAVRSGLLARAQLWAGFRLASGTAYYQCLFSFGGSVEFEPALSDEPCPASLLGRSLARLPASKQLDLRFAKRLGSAAYAPSIFIDARNFLNWRTAVRVISTPGGADGARLEATYRALGELHVTADANGVYDASTGTIQLPSGGGCASWVDYYDESRVPDCVALTRAEARWGNGDHAFTLDEQNAAMNAWFDATYLSTLNGPPRRIRLGIEFGI
jgi:hypothetical protein